MFRRTRLGLELLERKALLTGANSGLVASLTVNQVVAVSGTAVSMTFTETNASTHEIDVGHGPSNEGFAIRQGGKTVWVTYPGLVSQALTIDKLEPGQSISIQGTWDGRTNQGNILDTNEHGPQLIGNFTVVNGLDGGKKVASFRLVTSFKPTHLVPPRPAGHSIH